MNVMIIIGAITAFLGATVALTQTDIKRILAYSTMSQLGLMILACGAGAFIAATFHLLAHGASKAFLFLSAGSALQHLEATPHVEKEEQPTAWFAFPPSTLISAFSLAWLSPVLIALSGYGMLWFSPRSNGLSPLFWFIALMTVFLTALHLSRGLNRGTNKKMGPPGVTPSLVSPNSSLFLGLPGLGPAVLIATISSLVLAGALAWFWGGITTFLYPTVALSELPPNPSKLSFFTMMLILAGFGAALLGLIFSQFNLYGFIQGSPKRVGWYKRFYVLTHNKWYMDEICDAYIVRPNLKFSRWLWEAVDMRLIERFTLFSADGTVSFSRWLWKSVDVRIIGRVIEGTAGLTVGLARWLWASVDIRALGWLVDGTAKITQQTAGWLWRSVDIRWLERFVNGIGRKNEAAGQTLREIEPSMLQHQLLVMIFALVAALILFLLFLL
jgi:NADH-quinone oxidoreductase subunit L